MYLCSVNPIVQHIYSQLNDLYPEDEARSLAWWVAEETTGLTRTQLISGCKVTKNIPNLQTIIERLRNFEPIQYILGHMEWSGLDLLVTPATLIPRPETAELVEKIEAFSNQYSVISIQHSETPLRVLDIGTGSGCIAISLKKKHPNWHITAVDVSSDALEVARSNAERNKVDIDFRQVDILTKDSDFIGHFDLVVSNPPYVRESEKSSMRPNVLEYEPHSALIVPDSDPLLFYRRIASLRLGRYLFFEINEHLADETEHLLQSLGYSDIQTYSDSYGKNRIVSALLSSSEPI